MMLVLKDVYKSFHQDTVNEKKVFDGLNLEIKDKDFLTIVGSNGAGKSTLFNLISGNITVDKGSIYLNQENITYVPDYKRAKYIGRLFQDPLRGTAPHMSIKENLALAYLRAGHNSFFSRINKKDEAFFRKKLKLLEMGLEDRMDTLVGLLSGGQRQALTLLMATIIPPKILLLDEHTAALDPIMTDKIIHLTKNIVEESGITCLMITHHLKQALTIGNRTIFMEEGKIVLDIRDEERENTTAEELLNKFKENTKKDFDNDRMILSVQ